MQLVLILGIVVAISAVIFALQNNALVTVTLALWSFEGSLALLLLVALGLGALIAGLLSSPAVIRNQWLVNKLRSQVITLERQLADQKQRSQTLEDELARQRPALESVSVEQEKPYVGLRALIAGNPPPKDHL